MSKEKVRYYHFRYPSIMLYGENKYICNSNRITNPSPKGGLTIAIIENLQYESQGGNKYYIGVSVCSRTDNFCKRDGRAIALGRARVALYNDKKFVYPKTQTSLVKMAISDIPIDYIIY